jgi:hypothetical protein
MNTRLQNIVLLTLALGASNTEAYKYSITNRTNAKHAIDIVLAGIEHSPISLGDVEPGKTAEKDFAAYDPTGKGIFTSVYAPLPLRFFKVDGEEIEMRRPSREIAPGYGAFDLIEENGRLRAIEVNLKK